MSLYSRIALTFFGVATITLLVVGLWQIAIIAGVCFVWEVIHRR